MKKHETTFDDEDTEPDSLGLKSPLTDEEIVQFAAELPAELDFVGDYELLKKFIKNSCPTSFITHELILFIKVNILKIPKDRNNPIAIQIIEESVRISIETLGYLSASKILMQLKELIVRRKNSIASSI